MHFLIRQAALGGLREQATQRGRWHRLRRRRGRQGWYAGMRTCARWGWRVAWPAEPGAPICTHWCPEVSGGLGAATLWCVVGEPACSRPADAPRAVWCPIPPARGRAQWAIHECEHVSSCVGVNARERATCLRRGSRAERRRAGADACAGGRRVRSTRVCAQRAPRGGLARRGEAASGRGVGA